MTHRSTFALDDITAQRIRSLASLWKVSQAEVIRRAVAGAESSSIKPDPIALLQALHDAGNGLSAKTAKTYMAEVREDRKEWRKR